MIQRKQSLYLFISAIIIAVLLIFDPSYASFSGPNAENNPGFSNASLHFISTSLNSTSVIKWINILVLFSVGAGSLFAIFLFKKTELQKKLCIYMTLLSALFIIIMALDFNTMKMQFKGSETYPGIFSVLPVVVIVLLFMAWRGIRKDELLLKSMNRIR